MSAVSNDSNTAPPSYVEATENMDNQTYINIEFSPLDSATHLRLSSMTKFEDSTRTPIDLYVIMDISGSMNSKVSGCFESSGYTRFDLAVHAIKVILSNLSSQDYFTLITFNHDAKVVISRRSMHGHNVKYVENFLSDNISCSGTTNLYEGLDIAFKYLKNNPLSQTKQEFINRHFMIMTDGCPNMLPNYYSETKEAQEFKYYQEMIRKHSRDNHINKNTLIHTFGICHDDLNDDLLSSISKHGHGMYGFISDPTIITPCFINILAVLFNMFVTGLSLHIIANGDDDDKDQDLEHEIFIPWILQSSYVDFEISKLNFQKIKQSKSIKLISNTNRTMRVVIQSTSETNQDQKNQTEVSSITCKCTQLRFQVADYIICALDNCKSIQNQNINYQELKQRIQQIIEYIKQAKTNKNISWTQSEQTWMDKLIYDVDIYNRIKESSLKMWAAHCLKSLAMSLRDDYITNGYEKSYKIRAGDRLQYWINKIENVAKNVTPPNPSIKAYKGDGGYSSQQYQAPAYSNNNYNYSNYYGNSNSSSSSYFYSSTGRDYDDGCIDGNCCVEMADGSTKLVSQVVIGDQVRTDTGIGTIRCSILVPSNKLVELPNGLRITCMHPIYSEVDWIFPFNHCHAKSIILDEPIDMYSFLLEKADSTAMKINGYWVVHFAHNNNIHPVLKHDFYGTDLIRENIGKIDSLKTGKVCVTKALRNEQDQVYEYVGYAEMQV